MLFIQDNLIYAKKVQAAHSALPSHFSGRAFMQATFLLIVYRSQGILEIDEDLY